MSFLEQWNSVRSACFARLSLRLNPTSLRLTIARQPRKTWPRFEHYELVRGEDGKPVELGRGGDGGHIQGNSIRNMPKIASGAALSPP
jgi:hypothetical protein